MSWSTKKEIKLFIEKGQKLHTQLTCVQSLIYTKIYVISMFPRWCSDGKESACNAGKQFRSQGWKDLLEKGMATRSSILAWRIPWTEKPSQLQSMESQRVGHN